MVGEDLHSGPRSRGKVFTWFQLVVDPGARRKIFSGFGFQRNGNRCSLGDSLARKSTSRLTLLMQGFECCVTFVGSQPDWVSLGSRNVERSITTSSSVAVNSFCLDSTPLYAACARRRACWLGFLKKHKTGSIQLLLLHALLLHHRADPSRNNMLSHDWPVLTRLGQVCVSAGLPRHPVSSFGARFVDVSREVLPLPISISCRVAQTFSDESLAKMFF